MSNWKEVKLGSLCNLRRGASPRPISDSKYFGDGAGWVRISDVTSSKKYLKQTSQRLSSLGESKSVRVIPGDVIMSICATIGKPVIVDMDACIHDGFVVFKELNPEVDNEFLTYWLNMKEGYFNSLGQHGTQKNLNTSIINNTLIKLPPLKEQQKIAEILSSVDAAIEKTEQVIAKTEEVKKGLMQQLLTKGIGHTEFKQTEIGEIPLEWNIMKIAEFTNVKTGGTPSKKQQSYWENGNIPWMSSGEIHKKYIRDVDEYITIEGYNNSNVSILPIGSVMMALNGQGKTRGTVAILETETTCNQSLAAILPNDTVNEYFLYHLLDLKYQELRAITGDGARTGLNLSLIRNIIIQVPSMKEQLKIVQIINTIDVKLQSEKKNQRKLEALKTALMQQLLTGQMRVKID